MTTLVELQHIPHELQTLPEWVCYRSKPRKDGKIDKVPFNARTFKGADTSDATTWTSYEEAIAAWKHSQSTARPYDGVGFVFASHHIGIDLDDCIDSETGKPYPWAQSIIDRFHSYTELSPSGTGIHIFVRGTLLGGRKRKLDGHKIEIYGQERFFTITGKHLAGTPDRIEDGQEAALALYEELAPPKSPRHQPTPATPLDLDDTTLLEIAGNASNGARFTALWNGDISGYASASEADLALCGSLMFYTGNDESRVDRLYRQSALYREKWDRDDYRARTLEAARCQQVYQPRRPHTPDFLTLLRLNAPAQAPVPSAGSEPENLYLADEGVLLSYRHNFAALTPAEIDAMSEEEAKQTAKELLSLNASILGCVYNPYAKATTRLVAVDTLVNAAHRTARGLQASITDKAPVCIGNDYGIASRLGVSRNVVSAAFKTMEDEAVLVREREYDEEDREHLRVSLQPTLLTNFGAVQDRVERKPTSPKEFKPSGIGTECVTCDSPNIDIICRDCGNVQQLGTVATSQGREPEVADFSDSHFGGGLCTKNEQSYDTVEIETAQKKCIDPPQNDYRKDKAETSEKVQLRRWPSPAEWITGEPCAKCGYNQYYESGRFVMCCWCLPHVGYRETLEASYPQNKPESAQPKSKTAEEPQFAGGEFYDWMKPV